MFLHYFAILARATFAAMIGSYRATSAKITYFKDPAEIITIFLPMMLYYLCFYCTRNEEAIAGRYRPLTILFLRPYCCGTAYFSLLAT